MNPKFGQWKTAPFGAKKPKKKGRKLQSLRPSSTNQLGINLSHDQSSERKD